MNKVTVTFLHNDNKFNFEFKEFSDALQEYYNQCKHMGHHAGYVKGEWIISLIINNEIYKQLKLISINS
jgi:hypothetical protein